MKLTSTPQAPPNYFAGKVGIGTNSPAAKLDVQIETISNNTSQNIIQLGDGGVGGAGITLNRYANLKLRHKFSLLREVLQKKCALPTMVKLVLVHQIHKQN